MIQRTKRVFPGMVVSMMLVAPAYAAPAPEAAPQTQTRKVSHHATIGRGAGRAAAAVGRPRRVRHVDSSAPAMLGDAVAWSVPEHARERGDDRIASHGVQTGMASWYGGPRWHGHMTSSGEHFDEEALTAAHATLPLGTLVRVSMVDGSGAVVVKITDRPGTRKRIIDLSHAAARELGLLGRGIAMVRLEPL